jgi:hypothetical protein
MKKLFLCVLIVFCSTFAGDFGNTAFCKTGVQAIECFSDIERIEWICIDNQWYKIIYYTDDVKEIYPVAGTGVD